jgi:hypothetical protein
MTLPRLFGCFALFLVCCAACAAQTTTVGSGSGSGTFQVGSGSGSGTFTFSFTQAVGCLPGPPFYLCAQTNVNLIPNAPVPFGGLFGANGVATPNDFNAPMARITDSATESDNLNRSFVTFDSADVNEFNYDDSFLALRDEEAQALLYAFTPATLQSQRLYPSQPGGGLRIAGSGFYGYTLADKFLYFYQPAASLKLSYYDLTNACNPSCSAPAFAPVTVVLHDFGTDCVSGIPTWLDDGGTDKADDNFFSAAYSFTGVQGTGTDICVYNRSTNSSCHFNTSTGVVSGAGCISTGTVSLPDRFTIHNHKIGRGAGANSQVVIQPTSCLYTLPLSLSATQTIVGTTATMTLQSAYTGTVGAVVIPAGITGPAGASGLATCSRFGCPVTAVAGAVVTYTLSSAPGNFSGVVTGGTTTACGAAQDSPYFWNTATTTMAISATPPNADGSGHWCNGNTHWVNNAGTPGGNYDIRGYTTPTVFTRLIPVGDFPAGGSQVPLDQHCTWGNVDALDTYPVLASTAAYTGAGVQKAWANEIIGINPNGTSPVLRLGHTFITGLSQFFDTQFGLGSVSPDGKFFIFTSDMLGGLGSSSGSGTCTIGATCRADAFVLQLR